MSLLWLVLALLPVLGGAERFSCRGRILGAYYADAKSGCKAFHVCVRVAGGGIRDFRFFCPPGTLFHQEAQTCTDWGDDDPLACPADLYDGSFDLYKISAGFDTKKLSSSGNRDEEPEFGLQRAETGDRRLAQNSAATNNGPASDLRAAHSSDFFSGTRERGRDETAAVTSAPSSISPRQSFRRVTTPRQTPSTTLPPPSPSPSSQPQYEQTKRKFIRKRPVYVAPSTLAPSTYAQPSTFAQSSQQPRQFSTEQQRNNFGNEQQQRNTFGNDQQQRNNFANEQQRNSFGSDQQRSNFENEQQRHNFRSEIPRNNFEEKARVTPLADIPPQFKEFKDEYVEVPRVTPKTTKDNSKYFLAQSTPFRSSSTPFTQATPASRNPKNEGLVEIYNYESQSTPAYNGQGESQRYKVRNNFNVSPEGPQNQDVSRKNVNVIPNGERRAPSAPENNGLSRNSGTSTPPYRNFNSVSYEQEKQNYPQFSGAKQNYLNGPTLVPSTTAHTTTTRRPEPPHNLNTVAYNTNIGFNAQQVDYAESDEDDGQYRPPPGEDDGQYRPELYERESELLSGAHSLNIAASGNRLPNDQKPRTKSSQQKTQQQKLQKQNPPQQSDNNLSQTAAPRPFRPAPTPSSSSAPTSRAPEPTYTTTFRPQPTYTTTFRPQPTYTTTFRPQPTYTTTFQPQPPSTQRTFDYVQTYTTTVRPSEPPAFLPQSQNYNSAVRQPTSTVAPPRSPEPRPETRAPAPPTAPPARPTSKPPHFAQPASNKEDNSYDYAYYDSDSGFSEYDHIEEFGKTKSKA